ncbi:MAG: kelch repeat-containing protein, partial [Acidimicrobiales bacterium]
MNRSRRPLTALAVVVAVVAVAAPSPAAPRPWTRTADLGTPRVAHTLTVLEGPRCGPSCGKVLAAGGLRGAGELLETAELYDPVARTWTPTGSAPRPRQGHTATLLSDGRVLVVGGTIVDGGLPSPTADIYDPTTGAWSTTGAMRIGRAGHAAVLLSGPDCGSNCGKVLVAGGQTDQSPGQESSDETSVAELYDPRSGSWELTGSLVIPRSAPTLAVLLTPPGCALRCGKVLLVGRSRASHLNDNRQATELYDPVTGLWSPAGTRTTFGYPGAMAQLLDGTVLAVDYSNDAITRLPRAADRFNPQTGAWTPAPPPPIDEVRFLLRLPDGRLLATDGGAGGTTVLYRPVDDRWEVSDPLNDARAGPGAVVLGCRSSRGRVLVAGGAVPVPGGLVVLAGSELFDRVPTVQAVAPAAGPLAGGTTVKLSGTGLAPDRAVVVRIGDRDATVVDADPAGAGITAVTPAGAAQGPVPVTVTVDGVPAEVCAPPFAYGPNPTGPNIRELSVVGTSVVEGDRGATPATFRVNLNQPLDRPVSVSWATHDATATAGQDYEAARGSVAIPAGQTGTDVVVNVLGDTIDEPDETFTLAVAADDAGLRVAVPQAVATIVDDDGPPTPAVAPPSAPSPDPAPPGPVPPQPGGTAGLPGNLPQLGPGSPTNPLVGPGSASQPGVGPASQPGQSFSSQLGG